MNRPLLTAATLAAVLMACNRPPVQAPAGEPINEYLKTIDVEGNRQLGDKQLMTGLALRRTQKRGRAVDPYVIELDAERIRGEYLREGFLRIEVQSRVERAGDATTVIYSVKEGERATTKVEIRGIADRDLAALVRAELKLSDGAPFDYAVYDAAKEPLLDAVENAGYARARLDVSVYADRAANVAVVHLDYELGPKCIFGTVEIEGVGTELTDAVRGRLTFAAGDPYSTRALVSTRSALYGLARFSTVQVEPQIEGDAPVVEVRVTVAESARHEIKLGGGFGIDPIAYEVRARAAYSITGWPFVLDTVRLELRPAYAYLRAGEFQPRMRALARFERQDLFWTYGKGDVEGSYKYLSIQAYTSYGPGARIGFATPLWTQRVQLHNGWGIERLEFRNISPLIDPALQMQLGLDRPQRVGMYTQALSVDLRDNPVEPRGGVYLELRTIEGTRFAGGAFDYFEVIPDIRLYVSLGPVVIASRVRVGSIMGDVPVTERLFSGGGSNHRGFGERALAPTVSGIVDGELQHVPYGGAVLLETGFEVRAPITSWRKIGIGGVVFLDGGDVTETRAELDPLDLHWAVGAGLRFRTIAGPLRADLGYRLNRTGASEPSPGTRLALHISLGEAF